MIELLYSLLGFIIAIGILAGIHEFGHFWVARRVGVKVIRFSIGFGKRLFGWHDKKGTEYVVCAVPLGGYVKMLDQNEGKVAKNDLAHAFNNKPLWARALVILAGPIFNLLFAVLAYWLVFVWGISTVVPILGNVPADSLAYKAGLRSEQEIVAIDNTPTSTWEDIVVNLASHAGNNDSVVITVKDLNNTTHKHTLELKDWTLDNDGQMLTQLGLVPFDPIKPIVGDLTPDFPAQKAGVIVGDVITQVDGKPITNISQLLDVMKNTYGKEISIQVARDGVIKTLHITPQRKVASDGSVTGFMGIQFAKQVLPKEMIRIQQINAFQAVGMAIQKTSDYSILTLQFLGKMVMGKISLQHISGPISIAQYAGVTVRAGIENFITFLALISISLGVINLLPIPVLDGGHLLFLSIEALRGKPVSVRTMNVSIMVGVVMLSGIMALAIYNDLLRILH